MPVSSVSLSYNRGTDSIDMGRATLLPIHPPPPLACSSSCSVHRGREFSVSVKFHGFFSSLFVIAWLVGLLCASFHLECQVYQKLDMGGIVVVIVVVIVGGCSSLCGVWASRMGDRELGFQSNQTNDLSN